MTKKEAREYIRRYRLVNRVTDRELRLTPLEVKFQQMESVYRMAVGLGILEKMKAEKKMSEPEVRQRWLRLKSRRGV